MRVMRILIDSGAYSAWTKGTMISLDGYIYFLLCNADLIYDYVNLDVIPGVDGQREFRTDHIDKAAAQSYANQQRMKRAGLHPIPVFHQDERLGWLERYISDGEPYIAVAPFSTDPNAICWLDDVFALLHDHPHVRVHGLGVTAHLLLHRYPWFSVNSATWVKQSAVGQIPLPVYRAGAGKPDYALPPDLLALTDRSRGRAGRHIDDGDEWVLARLQRYLSEVGIDVSEARQHARARWCIWLTYFKGLQLSSGARIYFATDTSPQQQRYLTQYQIEHRLLSYFKLRAASRKDVKRAIRNYVNQAAGV